MAVLPEPRDIRVEVSERDLKWDFMLENMNRDEEDGEYEEMKMEMTSARRGFGLSSVQCGVL